MIAAAMIVACTNAREEKGEIKLSPTISIDFKKIHQTLDGFGATTMALANTYPALPQDTLGELRPAVIKALYKDVGINTGNLDTVVLESPFTDSVAYKVGWTGVDKRQAESMKVLLIDLAEPFGFTDYYFGKLNTRWGHPRMKDLMKKDYGRFLDECARYLTSIMVFWRDSYGITPRFLMPFNEPLSGNRELADGEASDIANILKRTGAMLRQEGFNQVKFVVPNEETEEKSLDTATKILADQEARQYVGAIGYHPYPYGSVYASVPRILETSGRGKPDRGRVAVRQKLFELGQKYSLPLWMTEVSHPEVDPRSFDHLRGRAIHIHDEFVYAFASAYYAMNNMWDLTTHRDHFKNDDIYSEADTVVLVNNETGEIMITGMGYAIGHYSRWIKPGAVRVEAASSEPLLLVTAFLDNTLKKLVTVVINNSSETQNVQFDLKNAQISSSLTGECSTGQGTFPTSYWQTLDSWQPTSDNTFSAVLPALSVTSIAGVVI